MNKLFTFILLLVASHISAQHNPAHRSLNAVPLNEIDSNYAGNGNWTLLHNVARSYSVDCLDTFDLFSNATGDVSRDLVTWQTGYDGQPYRATIISQIYSGGTWTNYGNSATTRFTNTCQDSLILDQGWSGSSWYDNIGEQSTATFDVQQQPQTVNTQMFDPGSGLWYTSLIKTFHYDGSSKMIGSDYIQWPYYSATNPTYYIDTNFAYTYYNSYCDSKLDSYETWKMTAGTWAPYLKATYQYFPNGGAKYCTLAWNGSSYDSSTIYLQLNDRYGNDSLYILWSYNNGTHQFAIESHDIYVNTYDANDNLIRVEDISNYQTASRDSVQPYTITRYSNYVNCGSVATGAESLSTGTGFAVSPNPNMGKATITLSEYPSEDVTMTITDMMGQKVQQQPLYAIKSEISLEEADGVYILTISAPTGNTTRRMVIQR